MVRDQDIFGQPVTLRYKGQRNFTTIFGGLMSILLFLALAAGFIYQLVESLTEPQFQSFPPTYSFDSSAGNIKVNVSSTDMTIFVGLEAWAKSEQ